MMVADRVSTLVVFLLLVQVRADTNGTFGIDMVVIFHQGAQADDYSLKALKQTLKNELPDVFPIGDSKTRVAIIANDKHGERNIWKKIRGLSADINDIKNHVDRISHIKGGLDHNLNTAFELAEKETFVHGTRRANVILLLIDNDPTESQSSSFNTANRLRDDGVLIFALHFQHPKNETSIEELKKIVGGNENYYWLVGGFANDFKGQEATTRLTEIKHKIEKQLCVYEKKCFFIDDQKTCEKTWYTPKLPMDGGDCSRISTPQTEETHESCDVAECDKTCDKLWPWKNEPDCTKKKDCGTEQSGKRNFGHRWANLKFCSNTKSCPPCNASYWPTKRAVTVAPSILPLALGISIPSAVLVVLISAVCGYVIIKRGSFRFKKRQVNKGVSRKSKKASSKKNGAKRADEDAEEGKTTVSETECGEVKSMTTVSGKKSPDPEEEEEEEEGEKKSKSGKKGKKDKACKLKKSKPIGRRR